MLLSPPAACMLADSPEVAEEISSLAANPRGKSQSEIQALIKVWPAVLPWAQLWALGWPSHPAANALRHATAAFAMRMEPSSFICFVYHLLR